MERTALAGMRRCLKSGKGLRCTTSSSPKCIAMAICPSKNAANSSAGISMSANPPTPKTKSPTPTILRTRLTDNSLLSRRPYSSSSSSSPSTTQSNTTNSETETEAVGTARKALIAPTHMDEAEKDIWELLNKELEPHRLEVKDVSGGCGSMYAIEVTSEKFRGLGMLKQQRLVNGVLGERVKGWHGVQMKTGVP